VLMASGWLVRQHTGNSGWIDIIWTFSLEPAQLESPTEFNCARRYPGGNTRPPSCQPRADQARPG
jgi:hypothetical protein